MSMVGVGLDLVEVVRVERMLRDKGESRMVPVSSKKAEHRLQS